MVKSKIVTVSAAAMVDVDNKVLIAQRQKDKFMKDYWEFPGGKLEDGELPNECLIREIREELNIDISDSCFTPITFTTFDYPNFSVIIFLYICREWEGVIQANEGQSLKWCRPNDLFKIKMLPADISLISYLRDTVS
ncbi:(deoxy)nucleoside triphosphate pyrophosphohydrolase [bacterium]|nr:(deoxy)nucleoside triphosphate pyrophosphohydrolase [bacterium]